MEIDLGVSFIETSKDLAFRRAKDQLRDILISIDEDIGLCFEGNLRFEDFMARHARQVGYDGLIAYPFDVFDVHCVLMLRLGKGSPCHEDRSHL